MDYDKDMVEKAARYIFYTLRTGDTQDLHANLWNMSILEMHIFTESFLTPVFWNKTWPITFPRRYVS